MIIKLKKKGVTEYVLILYLKIKRGRLIYMYLYMFVYVENVGKMCICRKLRMENTCQVTQESAYIV